VVGDSNHVDQRTVDKNVNVAAMKLFVNRTMANVEGRF